MIDDIVVLLSGCCDLMIGPVTARPCFFNFNQPSLKLVNIFFSRRYCISVAKCVMSCLDMGLGSGSGRPCCIHSNAPSFSYFNLLFVLFFLFFPLVSSFCISRALFFLALFFSLFSSFSLLFAHGSLFASPSLSLQLTFLYPIHSLQHQHTLQSSSSSW